MTVARRQIAGVAILAGLLLTAGGIIGYRTYSSLTFFEPRRLLSRFPAEDALAVSIDVSLLRRAGLLGDSKAAPEPDYKQFVDGTGFDYKRDLDFVAASFSKSGTFFIARGHFQWPRLREYAIHQGGSCYQDLCRIEGSRPERHISFLPLRDDAMALAVSTDDLAATRLTKASQPLASVPSAPVWISVPGAELRRQNSLPPGMHMMLSALTSADRIVITFVPAGQAIEARMEATCRTLEDAKALATQLQNTTRLLKEAAARNTTAADDEITALLTSGSFYQSDMRVNGKWPVRRTLLAALTDGI